MINHKIAILLAITINSACATRSNPDACEVDASARECNPGFVCKGGRCVQQMPVNDGAVDNASAGPDAAAYTADGPAAEAADRPALNDSAADAAALLIERTMPAAGSLSVSPSSSIEVVFGANLEATSADYENIKVSDGFGNDVAGRWSAGSRTLSFAADPQLPLLSAIKVVLPAGLRATDRSVLQEEYSFSFRTTDGTWRDPVELAIDIGENGGLVDVASDEFGSAAVVWQQAPGGLSARPKVFASVYSPGKSWTLPQAFTTSQPAAYPRVIMSGGTAVAFWRQYSGNGNNGAIYASRYVDGRWQGVEPLEDSEGESEVFRLRAVFANSDALLVWAERRVTSDIWWAGLVGGAWRKGTILSEEGMRSTGPVLAAGGDRAIACWTEGNETTAAWRGVCRSFMGASWSSSIALPDGFSPLAAAVDAAGQAAVLGYRLMPGQNASVLVTRLQAGTWLEEEVLRTVDRVDRAPAEATMAAGPRGRFSAVWEEDRQVFAADRSGDSGRWSVRALGSSSYEPRVVIDGQGHAIALWSTFSGSEREIHWNRYLMGSGWSAASDRFPFGPNLNTAFSGRLAISGTGIVTVSWVEASSGPGSWLRPTIRARRFQ